MKKNMTIEEYHAHHAVGSSSLRTLIDRSPAHYLWERENPSEPTPAQRLGQMIHASILEPQCFQELAIVEPEFSGLGSKAAKEQWHIENHGKMIMKRDHFDMITGILANISKHSIASKLLATGAPEESYFWIDRETGRQCKCRPDRLRENHIIVDVKSTIDASTPAFEKAIGNFGYHIQAAFYLDGVSTVLKNKFDDFTIVAVEKDPPYAVNTFRLKEETLQEGRSLYIHALKTLKQCQESGKWPAYPEKINAVGILPWAYKTEVY